MQQSLFNEMQYRDMSVLNQDDIRNGNFKEVAANLKKFYPDLKILCGKEPGFQIYLIAVVEKNSENCIQFEESYLGEHYDYMACLREYFQDAKDDETVHGLIEKYKITKNENNMLNYTFNQSIIKYGKEAQCRQLMEECAELIKATNKMLRYADRPAEPEYYANLIEEIADVEIMLYQLKVMFNISDDEVFAFKVEKAKREQERLKKL